MLPPSFGRMQLLCVAFRRAAPMLDGPIDRMSHDGRRIICGAGDHHVVLDGWWNQSFTPNGSPLLGSGNWQAEPVEIGTPSVPRLAEPASEEEKARRAGVLSVAIYDALMETNAKIDRLEVQPDGIHVWAEGKHVLITEAEAKFDAENARRAAL